MMVRVGGGRRLRLVARGHGSGRDGPGGGRAAARGSVLEGRNREDGEERGKQEGVVSAYCLIQVGWGGINAPIPKDHVQIEHAGRGLMGGDRVIKGRGREGDVLSPERCVKVEHEGSRSVLLRTCAGGEGWR